MCVDDKRTVLCETHNGEITTKLLRNEFGFYHVEQHRGNLRLFTQVFSDFNRARIIFKQYDNYA